LFIGLGVLGVIVLIVIGFLVFGGGDDDDETADTTTTTEDTTTTTEDTTTTTEDTTDTTSVTGDFTADEQTVYNNVPVEFDETCVSAETLDTAIATLECTPLDGADVAFYSTFDSVADMDVRYDAIISGFVARNEADCRTTTPGEGPFTEGSVSGRLACFDDENGGTRLIWTDEADVILVEAVRDDGDDIALYSWWSEDDDAKLF
jgi:hypothetical protein